MPTKKPRVTFAINEDRLSEITAYQTRNKIKNQSQAILALIEKGLSDLLPNEIKKAPPPDMGEEKLVSMYRELNSEGQERILTYADDLVSSGKYKKGRAVRMDTKEA